MIAVTELRIRKESRFGKTPEIQDVADAELFKAGPLFFAEKTERTASKQEFRLYGSVVDGPVSAEFPEIHLFAKALYICHSCFLSESAENNM